MRILLQFPEGLKQEALKHAKRLEAEGNDVFISASPTYGACDLALDEARNIGADKLVHFGHAEFNKVDFNVEYVEYSIDAPLDMLEKALPLLEGRDAIGVVVTIQQIHQLPVVKEFFERNGKRVVIGKPYGFAKKQGQILGCDIGSAASIDSKVDAFVNTACPRIAIDDIDRTTAPLLSANELMDVIRMKGELRLKDIPGY